MIESNRAQIPIIQDQAEEAIRRVRLNVKALEEQLAMATQCLEEEVRAENKDMAYDLSLLGINVIDRVSSADDQRALNEELRKMLAETKRNGSKIQGGVDDLDAFLMRK